MRHDGVTLRDSDPDAPVPGLMAIGEAACVSVHGANRLGSNSLIDLIVFGRAAAQRAAETVTPGERHAPLDRGSEERAVRPSRRGRRDLHHRQAGSLEYAFERRADNPAESARVLSGASPDCVTLIQDGFCENRAKICRSHGCLARHRRSVGKGVPRSNLSLPAHAR